MSALAVGQEIPALRVEAGLPEMKLFSLIMADPNPIHFDPEHTAALGMGPRPINQGTLNMAYPIDALIAVIGDPARIRRFQCRFLGNVVAGDVLDAAGRVLAIEDGVATVELWLDQVDGPRVLAGIAEVSIVD
ncbi:MAG: hypothetical protein J7480_03965 [Microbacteriaceae bacterium]|nr:hypothetical protein [Microbacteriaceae bacterium]